MRFHMLYVDTKYEVCMKIRIRAMANCLIFYSLETNLTLTCGQAAKVIDIWIVECALFGSTLVSSMKFVDETASEIWLVA